MKWEKRILYKKKIITTALGVMLSIPMSMGIAHADTDVTDTEETSVQESSSSQGNMVTFGDSYFADSANAADGMGLSGCPVSDANVPSLTAHALNLELKDYSCSGAVAYFVGEGRQGMDVQVDKAVENHDLNEDTELVSISIGGNDGIFNYLTPEIMQNNSYFSAMDKMVSTIKEEAPNATVQIVGYPKMTSSDGSICLPIHVNSMLPQLVSPDFLVKRGEEVINHYQSVVADKYDAQFINLKEVSDGHGPCSAPDQRWVSGMVDTDSESKMPMHLTTLGNESVSQEMVRMAKAELEDKFDDDSSSSSSNDEKDDAEETASSATASSTKETESKKSSSVKETEVDEEEITSTQSSSSTTSSSKKENENDKESKTEKNSKSSQSTVEPVPLS